MAEEIEYSQGKSVNELGNEAGWFLIHSVIALVTLFIILGIGMLLHPDPDAAGPKLLGTALAFIAPLIVGFLVAKQQNNDIAEYVWIAGLLIFAVACVWVLDLPTGNGLCDDCAGHAFYRLQRTFFSIDHGSGLIAGNGMLVGTWIPLSLFGYSIGSRFGLSSN